MGSRMTIRQLLQTGRDHATAVSAVDRPPMTYGGLRAHVTRTVATLNDAGIGRNDRVAIVLPNGPEMVVAFLSVASCATAAPLNPSYTRAEFDFYLSDLDALALIVCEDMESVAVAAARAHGIQVFQLSVRTHEPAGVFALETSNNKERIAAATPGLARPDDIALVLHTSGTTSKPKIVPLSHTNVCASARNIQTSLRLDATDVCMNIMPLFHIHGLMASVLATMGAGGSVFSTPGFDAFRFFGWFDAVRPTWFTAVPTMHQAILARSRQHADIFNRARLRFIRSSSSSLPPQVMAELENAFGVPVVEAYAMTEAAHQMTCNPLPPGMRKSGTVGRSAGPEVAIMDEKSAAILRSGQAGEVVIKGENVTAGYENNPAANAEGFVDGWFRTGDQGVMDEEGYLTITGRLKEIINRGGEKISPREVDDVLMDHDAVQQVVTFAVPHDYLGEEIAAAIVLRKGALADERDIQSFAAKRLAPFKVPQLILLVDKIPTGATGKLQRIGLAEKFGLG